MEETLTIRPSVCFEVQKVIGVSIGEGNLRNYQVQWAPSWVTGFHLMGCEHLIEQFIQKQSETDQCVSNQRSGVTDADNVQCIKDSTYRRQFTENIHRRASMAVNGESSLNVYTNTTNDNSYAKDVSMETNESNEGESKTTNCNPNFEWVGRSVDHTQNNGYSNEEESVVLSVNHNKTVKIADGENTIPNGEDQRQNMKPRLHYSREIAERKKFEMSSTSQNDDFELPNDSETIEVKEEEIILVELSETDQHPGLNKDNEEYECNTCHEVFQNSSALTQHSDRTHGVGNIYECALCNRKCESKACLRKHKLTHGAQMQFKCHLCGEAFSENKYVISHMRTHQKGSHKCNYCDKVCVSKSILERHVRVHTGERPFQCELCPKAYKRKEDLLIHCRNHFGPPETIYNHI